jgi:hypothetical protein
MVSKHGGTDRQLPVPVFAGRLDGVERAPPKQPPHRGKAPPRTGDRPHRPSSYPDRREHEPPSPQPRPLRRSRYACSGMVRPVPWERSRFTHRGQSVPDQRRSTGSDHPQGGSIAKRPGARDLRLPRLDVARSISGVAPEILRAVSASAAKFVPLRPILRWHLLPLCVLARPRRHRRTHRTAERRAVRAGRARSARLPSVARR